jgi:hypothetical protein
MLVRCDKHPSKKYRHSVKPVGHPNTAAICGRCDEPGMILLNEAEWKAYQGGQRVFSFNSNIVQVRAEDPSFGH